MAITEIKHQFDRTCQLACAKTQAIAVSGARGLRRRAEAADTVEYVLMAAIFCLGITAVAFLLRDKIEDIFSGIKNNLANAAKGSNIA